MSEELEPCSECDMPCCEYKASQIAQREAELVETIRELRESLKKICVYDMYDCSESSDINYHDDAKDMYETAKQALEKTKEYES